jgi:hypothetical protein
VAVAGDAPMLPAVGTARSNATRPHVLARLARPGGATLAELTKASGWRAPYELGNPTKMARGQGKAVKHHGGDDAARRYLAGLTPDRPGRPPPRIRGGVRR